MLEVKNLSYNTMIQDISLNFLPGTITGIIGPNGSGKTTFLKTLKKIWLPSSGEVFWNHISLHSLPRQKISKVMALVPQNPQIAFGFTVREFLEMGGYPDSVDERLYRQILIEMDLASLEDRPATELSGGERQRVYIARSLMTGAPVMLLDEPTANLDINHQQGILTTLTEQAGKGKAIVITTHDLGLAKILCDRVAVFSKGRCVGCGQFEEIVTENVLWECFRVKGLLIN